MLFPTMALGNYNETRNGIIERSWVWQGVLHQKKLKGPAVRQELLDMYRAAHPNYNFPKNSDELTQKQTNQILDYFFENYRFGEIKYKEISKKLFEMFLEIPFADFEVAVNEVIRKHYKLGKYWEGEEWRREYQVDFYAPFGSISTTSKLSNIKPENAEKILKLLNKVQY